ncbi:MAG TPA: DUF4012 domain-containing protein, partial [Candidatus Paceibacterota bacterium]
GRLLLSLKKVDERLVDLKEKGSYLRNLVYKFDALTPDMNSEYLNLSMDLDYAISGLRAIIGFLDDQSPKHIVVIFENPSEIRPGGGFFGSYADLIIQNGAIKEINVDDIYRPDKFSDFKVVPPLHLQGVTTLWGARDANWFFDFRKSASKIMLFLEESDIFKDNGIQFDGVIAINVRLVEDILKIIGDIDLPEYDLVLNSDNFLREVQYEVEAGRDKIPGQNPKKILSVITPRLIEALKNLEDEDKIKFLDDLNYRLSNKDIKFFFEDENLQNFVAKAGADGAVFETSKNFNGDYLAVVSANVAGGKSDYFIKQIINLNSRIDSSGMINNSLSITRTHSGEKEKEWWYRAQNNNFIKIFTTAGSKLIDVDGNSVKTITPSVDYKKSGYLVDKDLEEVEGSKELLAHLNTGVYRESGKTVFGTWFNVPAGKSKNLQLIYESSRKISLSNKVNYQFVLDKQSGVDSAFEYAIEAPAGFKWLESDSNLFKYSADNTESRLIINLTLIQL